MSYFEITATGYEPQSMVHIGSVENVIQGVVTEKLKKTQFDAALFDYGFEIASPGNDYKNMSEAVLVNNQCYAAMHNWSDLQEKPFISDRYFYTNGLFLIPKNSQSTHKALCRNISLSDVYRKIFEEIGGPYAFICYGAFEKTKVTAIEKSPIYNENIFSHKELYYPRGSKDKEKMPVFLVGAVTDYTFAFSQNKELSVVLYENPFDKQKGLTTHVHGLELNRKIENTAEINPLIVKNVWHFFEKETIIEEMNLSIYSIKDVKDFLVEKSG